MTEQRPYPEILTQDESAALLNIAEQLWSDLQTNNIGGFSGINRPFYILHEFRRVIETFGHRDTGLNWSKNDLDAAKAQGMTEPTVTQADRERAASIAVLTEMREIILAGRADHHAVPFARWREADMAEGVAMGIEAMRQSVEEVEGKGLADYCAGALSPAAIIAQHKRGEAMETKAE